jgi:hypothetical protein
MLWSGWTATLVELIGAARVEKGVVMMREAVDGTSGIAYIGAWAGPTRKPSICQVLGQAAHSRTLEGA